MQLHQHSSGACKSVSFSTSILEEKSDPFFFLPQMIFGQTQGRISREEVYETLEWGTSNIKE